MTSSPGLPQRRALLAGLLALLPMLLPLSVDGSLALIPDIAAYFNTGFSAAQYTLSAIVAGMAIGQLIYGPLSDRYGRKPVIMGGVACYTLAAAACTLATSIETLTLIRFFQGFFACSGVIVARAVIRDLFDREPGAQMFALMMGLHGFMPAVAPGIGGLIGQTWGWQAVFLTMAAFGIFTLSAIGLGLRESSPHRDGRAINPGALARNIGHILGNRSFRSYLACASLAYGAMFAYFAGAPVGLIHFLGLEPQEYGIAMAFPMVAYIIAQLLVARTIRRVGLERTVRRGIAMLLTAGVSATCFLVLEFVNLYTLIGPVMVMMVAHAYVIPVTTAGAVSPFPHMAGTASSVLGFVQFMSGAIVTALVGLFADGTPAPMTGAMLFCALGAALAWAALVRRELRRA